MKSTVAIAAALAAGSANAFVLVSHSSDPVYSGGTGISVVDGVVFDALGTQWSQVTDVFAGISGGSSADTYFGYGSGPDAPQAVVPVIHFDIPTAGFPGIAYAGIAPTGSLGTEAARTSRAISNVGEDALFIGRVATSDGAIGLRGLIQVTIKEPAGPVDSVGNSQGTNEVYLFDLETGEASVAALSPGGTVDALDIDSIINGFDSNPVDTSYSLLADLDGNGTVNGLDFNVVLNGLGRTNANGPMQGDTNAGRINDATAASAAQYSIVVVQGSDVFRLPPRSPVGFQDDVPVETFDLYIVREIPAPGAAGLLGVAGMAAARRRRCVR